MGRGKRGRRRNQGRHPMPDKPKTDQEQPDAGRDTPNAIAPLKTESQQPDSSQTTQRTTEQAEPPRNFEKEMADWTAYVGKWTEMVGVAAGLSVLVGAVGICATIWFGNVADETARAAQRPWMRYEPLEIIAPLVYENGKVSIKIRFHLRNTGNSPALHVFTRAELVMDQLLNTDAQRKLCADTEPKEDGYTSFPGEEPVREEAPLEASYPMFQLGGGPPVHFFTIVSCITYWSSFGDGEPHQTGIILNLLTTRPPTVKFVPQEVGMMALGIDPRLGNLQPNELRLAAWHLGSYAR